MIIIELADYGAMPSRRNRDSADVTQLSQRYDSLVALSWQIRFAPCLSLSLSQFSSCQAQPERRQTPSVLQSHIM